MKAGKHIAFLFAFAGLSFFFSCRRNHETVSTPPKLVVGIVVDQMRYDFLFRYWDKYGDGGFKRLVKDGYLCRNTHYDYFPTYTGPGHAAIYTGTGPANNGIVANDWYDRKLGQTTYVTDDSTVSPVGGSYQAGRMSPHYLMTTTITDQLKLSDNGRSKVIGIALKDRGSILPAGHMADAAYWFDPIMGNWITSTYYMKQLPSWVNKFNAKRLPLQYLKETWKPLLGDRKPYLKESLDDDNPYEKAFLDGEEPVFPYVLSNYAGADYEIVRKTPYGNTFTTEFAKAALDSEKLGQGEVTDFLAVSYSSTDYVGHQFGPNAMETEDTYLRLDKEIESLLDAIDKQVGKDNALVFLTADHGVSEVAAYLKKLNIPAGYFDGKEYTAQLNSYLAGIYGQGTWVSYYVNQQMYLNYDLALQMKIDITELENKSAAWLSNLDGVARVVTQNQLAQGPVSGMSKLYQNGLYPKRSGDVFIELNSGWVESIGSEKGTTHGSPFEYDTHVPLIWYGWHIPQGSSSAPVSITDIAPTIADMLNIMAPSGCIGHPIQFHAHNTH